MTSDIVLVLKRKKNTFFFFLIKPYLFYIFLTTLPAYSTTYHQSDLDFFSGIAEKLELEVSFELHWHKTIFDYSIFSSESSAAWYFAQSRGIAHTSCFLMCISWSMLWLFFHMLSLVHACACGTKTRWRLPPTPHLMPTYVHTCGGECLKTQHCSITINPKSSLSLSITKIKQLLF